MIQQRRTRVLERVRALTYEMDARERAEVKRVAREQGFRHDRNGLLVKAAAHADARLRQRTNLDPVVLARLRARVRAARLPRGAAHVRLPDGYAVLKDLGGRHVVATVLSRHMRPPGPDVTARVLGK